MAAIATISVGMGLGSQQGVHPFFERKKPVARCVRVSRKAPSSVEPPSVSVDDEIIDRPVQASNLPRQTLLSDTSDYRPTESNTDSEVTVSAHAIEHGSGHVLGDQRGHSLNERKVQEDLPSDQPKVVNTGEFASLDVDLNSARNKRRRLSDPEEHHLTSERQSVGWLAQLQEAAYGQPARLTFSQPDLTGGLSKPELDVTTGSLSGTETQDLKKTEDTITDPSVPAAEAVSPEMSLTNSSAKRKMLKLRPNGKLSSPTSKNRAIRRSTDKKVTGNQALPENHRVVILRYGLNSDSRNVIGQKIQPILSDSEERHSCNTEVSAEPLAGPKAVYSGTPKPTHPFFLGKAAAKQASNSNVSSEPIKLSSCSTSSDGSTPSLANTGQAERLPMFGHSSNSSASRDTIRTLRTSGGIEPAWPSKDAMHTRGLETVEDDVFKGYARQVKRQVKMKGSQIRIPRNEDILLLLASKISNQKLRTTVEGDPGRTENPHVLRVPQRKILTGAKLQALTREVVSARLAIPQPASEANPEKHLQSTYKNTHPAVSRHFLELPSSLTAFDQAQCEPYAWVQKYAPKRAEEVLQTGREAIILKDWLRSLTVDAVNAGVGSQINRDSTKRLPRDRAGIHISRRRKRRKRAELLDGFVISSGDEDEEMEELTSPEDANEDDSRGNSLSLKRTVVRIGDTKESLNDLGAISNAVLISGPHGCGKTAAVYATARELGFEVFELNPGSKRSGKDIMEKVGDMTQNHLVQHASDGSDLGDGDGALKDADALSEILTKRQRTLNPFTKSKGTAKSKSSNKPRDPKANLASEQAMKQHAKPKQSLILLEEVDILFDEDKHFWVTVLGLIARSKRPVVMTCNDESLVPLDEMSLYAILRFTPPARDIATDYLLLLAASEGHLLGRSAVQALYESKRLDLRASITELEFWCQMAIGDRKGGLEWMLERCSAANDSDDGGKRMRVVSEDAYLKGMGWLNRDNAISQEIMARDKEIELSVEAWHNWGIWVENWHGHEDASIRNPTIPVSTLESAKASLSDLEDYERLIDATSASDLLGSPGLRMGNLVVLDTTQPAITEKMHSNFIEGHTLIQSDLAVEHDDLSTLIALTTRTLAHCSLPAHGDQMRDAGVMEQHLVDQIACAEHKPHTSQCVTRHQISAAFAPVAEPADGNLNRSTGVLPSEFDRSMALIVEDLAPYVRSIISYDLRLEQERLRLSNLLSQGGRDGKRIRTTRASRAALEGGSKANTRRERWLPSGTNATLVLRTGGQGWQDVAAGYDMQGRGDAASSLDRSRGSPFDRALAEEG